MANTKNKTDKLTVVGSRYFAELWHSRMGDDLDLSGMSQRTREVYLRAVKKLTQFCKRSPDKITEAQLRKYFLYLKNDLKFAYGSLRVAFSGIKFFYTRTCKRDWETLATMKLQNVKRQEPSRRHYSRTSPPDHRSLQRPPSRQVLVDHLFAGVTAGGRVASPSRRYRLPADDGACAPRQGGQRPLCAAAQLYPASFARSLGRPFLRQPTLSRLRQGENLRLAGEADLASGESTGSALTGTSWR
jgi:hypothetical protein